MLHRPGLVVLTGPPGCGRTTLLRRLSAAVPGPAHEGGGLAMLQTVPALALSRAVRAKLPAHDVHLLAEAVRSRVRGGLLVIDDLHYTDPATLAALPLLAAHCRVLAAVRTPHRLPAATETALRAAATAWIPVPPLTAAESLELARRTAPQLDAAALTAVAERAGGNPLAVTALARNAASTPRTAPTSRSGGGPASGFHPGGAAPTFRSGGGTAPTFGSGGGPASGFRSGLAGAPAGPTGSGSEPDPAGGLWPGTVGPRPGPTRGSGDIDQVAYAIATALADLPRPARTALAALGLLGRPAPAALLGAGATDLHAAGLITADATGALLPVSTYVAETAAGLLDAAARVDLHTRLAELTPPAEAARHLAAAGDLAGAHRQALAAADQTTGGDRAALLLFACELDTPIDPRVRLAAADALLSVGRPAAAARVLTRSGSGSLTLGERPQSGATPDAAARPVLTRSDSDSLTFGERSHRAATPGAFGADFDFPHPPAAPPGSDLDVDGLDGPSSPSGRPDSDDPSSAVRRPLGHLGHLGAPSSAAHAAGAGSDGPGSLPGTARSHLDADKLRALELEADVLRGEALLQAGNPEAACAAVRAVPDAAAPSVVAGRDRVLLLAELATDPPAARDLADKIAARHPRPPAGVFAALAAVRAHFRQPGWDTALAEAATPGGDPLITRWSAWLLVEQLAADGRLTESASVALRAARDSATDLAYGWQTRFAAAADWALALHGTITADPAETTPAPADPPGRMPGPAQAAPAHGEIPATSTMPGGETATPTSGSVPAGPPQGLGHMRPGGIYGSASKPPTAADRRTLGNASPDAAAADLGTPGSAPPDAAAPLPVPDAAQPESAAASSSSATALPRVPDAAQPESATAASSGAPAAPTATAGGIHGAASSPVPGPGAPTAADDAHSSTSGGPEKQADVIAELWDGADGVLRRAGNLADRALPDEARGYATAATALIEADTGLLAAARAHLDGGPAHPATSWVAQETAWLDGQPDRAVTAGSDDETGLLAGLHAITAQWAAHDLGTDAAPVVPGGLPAAARRTLTAWATGTGFTAAAEGWRPIALRERIRCLLAAGLTDTDQARAVEALLAAERLADAAGLTVLAGRARRGLRRHHVHRDTRSKRSGDQLTRRETDVLRLVAAGEPTRRIAGQLGISAETVDTHIRAGMRKLGARTRTEAAALAFANPVRPDTSDKDGR
ncbi:LuxR C-terminal-related transcriptional regulator [Actinoplanes sp. CA-054009]